MKCLIFAEFSSTGGTRSFLKDLLSIHLKQSITTEVIFSSSASDCDIVQYIENMGFSHTIVPDRKSIFKKNYFSLIYELYYYPKIIIKVKPDFIVVSTGTPGENILFFLFNIPFVYILHTPVNSVAWRNRLMGKIPSLFSGNRKRIYAVSEFVNQSVLKNWKVKNIYVNVIYNSYRLNNNLINIPVKPKLVLTLGHVTDYKNPLLWLKIAKEITSVRQDVEFLWLGEGNMLAQLQDLTKYTDRIRFEGHKSNIQDFYQSAFIYLQPSLKESLGISVLDAMSAGIPTIVSNAEGLPETTEHGVSGYICVTNESSEYVKYIHLLLNDDELRKKLGDNGKKRANLFFSPKIQEVKIIDLYYSVARVV
jgi:glycosyltransferase involved in cell wall biosynthesis